MLGSGGMGLQGYQGSCKDNEARLPLGNRAIEELKRYTLVPRRQLSDAELNERINYANEQIIGDGGKPSSPISLPHPADGENAGKSRNPAYRTLQERFKDLPPFMRTDLTFNVINQAYRTVGQHETAWRPGEMDDTMDKVAYWTVAICQAVFGESALWNLCNQFNHSDVRSMIFCDLSPHERKELEMRIEKAAFHAGWGGWDEDSW
ncbi:hypothetical protein O988_05937 [Pseudogymnoascus sp. VKM F-3808]|nr:hypothetical protein O988_05937 [Pseudogymnoascus sp. VKM F-3808]